MQVHSRVRAETQLVGQRLVCITYIMRFSSPSIKSVTTGTERIKDQGDVRLAFRTDRMCVILSGAVAQQS